MRLDERAAERQVWLWQSLATSGNVGQRVASALHISMHNASTIPDASHIPNHDLHNRFGRHLGTSQRLRVGQELPAEEEALPLRCYRLLVLDKLFEGSNVGSWRPFPLKLLVGAQPELHLEVRQDRWGGVGGAVGLSMLGPASRWRGRYVAIRLDQIARL